LRAAALQKEIAFADFSHSAIANGAATAFSDWSFSGWIFQYWQFLSIKHRIAFEDVAFCFELRSKKSLPGIEHTAMLPF
jgi:hypothetical protein